MKHRKLNSLNVHIYDSFDTVAREHGTAIAMFANNYKPDFIIPPPFHAWCHQCNKGFMSIDELTKHDHKVHDTGYIGNKD